MYRNNWLPFWYPWAFCVISGHFLVTWDPTEILLEFEYDTILYLKLKRNFIHTLLEGTQFFFGVWLLY